MDADLRGLKRAWLQARDPNLGARYVQALLRATSDAAESLDAERALAINHALRLPDPERRLSLLLDAWRAHPLATLARWILAHAPEGESEAAARLRGLRKRDVQAAWLAVERSKRLSDRSALLETLHLGSISEVRARAQQLERWPADPRIQATLCDWLRELPFRSLSARPIWTVLFRHAQRQPDPHARPLLQAALQAGFVAGSAMGAHLNQKVTRLLARVDHPLHAPLTDALLDPTPQAPTTPWADALPAEPSTSAFLDAWAASEGVALERARIGRTFTARNGGLATVEFPDASAWGLYDLTADRCLAVSASPHAHAVSADGQVWAGADPEGLRWWRAPFDDPRVAPWPEGPRAIGWQLAFVGESARLAVLSWSLDEGSLSIYDPSRDAWEQALTCGGLRRRPPQLALDPSGRYAAVRDASQRVFVYDLKQRLLRQAFRTPRSGDHLVFPKPTALELGLAGSLVRIQPSTGKELGARPLPATTVDACVERAGTVYVTTQERVVEVGPPPRVLPHDPQAEQRRLDPTGWQVEVNKDGHARWTPLGAGPGGAARLVPPRVRAVACCAEGVWVVAAGGREVQVSSPEQRHRSYRAPATVQAVACSSTGASFFYASGTTIHWRQPQGLQALKGHKREVRSLAVTRDDAALVSGAQDHDLIVWSLSDGSRRRLPSGAPTVCVVAHPQARFVVASTTSGRVRLWDLEADAVVAEVESEPSPLAPHPDGRSVYACDGARLLRWWFEDGRCEEVWRGERALAAVWAHPSGSGVVVGDRGGEIVWWRDGSAEVLATGRGLLLPLTGSQDGSTLIVGGARPGCSESWTRWREAP